NIGRSRGCLVRVGDPLSRRLVFAAPAALIAAALGFLGAGVFLGTGGLAVAAAAALIYMTAAIAPQMEVRRWREALMMPFALFIHHGAYALGMAFGILTGTRTVRASIAERLPEGN
ncbi:MAG: hypothetical protein JO194_10540, partial [Candidatus Eremiobacteraeota bacterium]|nr:hypothetical protein [Candidatus Eremiobacteraeota bacterium]